MVEITIRKRPRTDAVVTQRKFFKKTARGKVIKGIRQVFKILETRLTKSLVLRERYLRDDVSCGIQNCSLCDSSLGSTLPSNGSFEHQLYSTGHFLVPDTNVFLSQVRSMLYSEVRYSPAVDGSYGILCIQPTHYSPANRYGRSQAPFAASLQSTESISESG